MGGRSRGLTRSHARFTQPLLTISEPNVRVVESSGIKRKITSLPGISCRRPSTLTTRGTAAGAEAPLTQRSSTRRAASHTSVASKTSISLLAQSGS